jgi:UDP-GlcNAc:undecaprenyl-phosphate/decaprenyl-phosphate GlcNAc-1-phosphate transferase
MPFFLHVTLNLADFKIGILALVTAFIVCMILMPPLIKFIHRFHLFDLPDLRKEHSAPIPTMGGLAAFAGMIAACMLWFPMSRDPYKLCFFLSVFVLLAIGIMDDLRNLSARYKFAIQLALSFLIAFSGARITTLHGIFGIHELPLLSQYTLTVLAITGITNAFNLIDGIDGLAGGLGFMSLLMLGIFLTLMHDPNDGILAFALGGGILGFLYYNFNPARIFMGDTGSLILGFVIAVLTVRIMQQSTPVSTHLITNPPVFALSIVFIPVFDTLRVFAVRIWSGRSPFSADKNHIHHQLTNNGWSHATTTAIICFLHALLLLLGYVLKSAPTLLAAGIFLGVMLLSVFIFQRLKLPAREVNWRAKAA